MKALVAWCCAAAVCVSPLAQAYDRITGSEFASRSEVIAQHGMAATSQPLASQVALDILKKGGNAVDAAIAANAVLGLVEPTGNGIGGDLFAIIWDAKSQQLYGLNASGRSPQSLSLEHLKSQGDKIPAYGPLPVSVPGTVDGWFEMHNKFGKLPMAELLQPAIDYSRGGFPVSELIAYYLERSVAARAKYPGFKDVFMPNGRMPKKGEIFRNPALANTLEAIAKGGRDAFYKGDIAKEIDRYMKANGGFLSYQDMVDHRSDWVKPVSSNYRGYDVWELPPNGQGIAALHILNLMEGFDVKAMGFGSVDYVHAFVEAKKIAFADRARFYADPDFSDIPVERIISKAYADKQRPEIDMKKAAKRDHAGPVEGDTIYMTTADKDGNMVSLIQSNFRGMGSGMTPAKLGFVLQNRGELFNFTEGHPNVYAPGKRPFHTIIPAFVTKDGKPWLSFGVMGGATQPQMHAQIVINMVDFGMNLQEAGDAPRILHTGSSQPTGEIMLDGGYVSLESGFPMTLRRELAKRGHVIRDSLGAYGGYQAILRDLESGIYYGASETRKDGQAAGY
ncbi:gamma-glutamyltransferase [Pseudoteredinibacter isoporae]|uniref:Glutathione hydrolase proenzyme n=1 Tax=Pseudoteredinibacter isoporae TaxID=570281 RepID=A0A7X0MVJ2_9GAMM|nr:gamma-glutamyltransferase [Pseudoteredinibacter isoporae]MBB6521175.1 gamma-glutamyltranspeptidase/glutathione hydrolase [Pseudoteredinibacter isoporae]NHO86735.1 gamma-glutamyltransferase [Pseudoteredinibacter isoporae]NIB24813.1 gamma-glutamyltransferase [Pseudoteredinibacter isoporae]